MDEKITEKSVDNSAESKPKKLTRKEDQFCYEYVYLRNGAEAARRAGYSEKSARQIASRLLTKDYILSRVHAIQIEECKKMSINEQSVLMALMEIFERCMQVKPVMIWDRELHEYVESGEYSFNARGALDAQNKIGEYLGMFKQNVNANINGSLDSTVKIEDLIK